MRKMTSHGEIIPCYYPTNVAAVDDESYFLRCLNDILFHDVCYMPYITASSALRHLNYSSNDEHFVKKTQSVDLKGITGDIHRFNQTTVLVVDYKMPDMNGLALCQKITNPNVKKVMLTGVATQAEGEEALNNNVIDFFLRKDDSECGAKLNSIINDYQYEHCTQQYLSLTENKEQCPFITDSTFINLYFSPMLAKYNIVEYYFEQLFDKHTQSFIPWSFVLIDSKGSAYRMNIFTDDIVNDLVKLCQGNQVPTDVINMLDSRKLLLNFRKPNGGECKEWVDWYNCLEPAVKVTGKVPYYCTLSPVLISADKQEKTVYSYQDHIKKNDGYNIMQTLS